MKPLQKTIIYITSTNLNSSTAPANRAIALLNSLVKENIKVVAMHATLNNKKKHPCRKATNFEQIFFLNKTNSCLLNYFFLIIVAIKLLKEISKLKKSNCILYVYGFGFYTVFLTAVAKVIFKLKLIREFTEHPFFNNNSKLLSILSLRIAVWSADKIFVISKNLKTYLKSYTKTSISILNMIVDSDRFEKQFFEKQRLITYVGTIETEKDGINDLIEAFKIFKGMGTSDLKLRIVADTSNKARFMILRNLCEKLGVLDSVIFTGAKHSNEIPKMLFESILLVLPRPNNLQSKYGFPTKLGEYIASEVPTISTNVGSINQFIKDEINGFLVDPGNSVKFAEKMIRVIGNYEKAILIAKKGKELLKLAFNPDIQAKKIVSYINKNGIVN